MALTKKVIGAVAAIALILTTVLTFAFKADNSAVASRKLAPVTVYFTPSSNDPELIQEESNWKQTPPTSPCSGSDYICRVIYDSATYPTLADFLANSPTQADVEDNAISVVHKD